MDSPSRLHGFSLVELLVVVAITAALASIAMPLAELSKQREKEEELRRSLRELRDAIDAYKRLVDLGVVERRADRSGYPPTIDILAEGVVDARTPQRARIFLLRRIPRDPFATSAEVKDSETWATRSYSSGPENPQPGDDVFDVHSKANAIGLNGIPYSAW